MFAILIWSIPFKLINELTKFIKKETVTSYHKTGHIRILEYLRRT